MKKLFCVLMGLIAHAAHALPSPDHTFTGAYVTAGVGASGVRFNATKNVMTINGIPFEFTINQENDFHARSASGLVGLSYMYQFPKPLVLGVEVTAGYMDAEQTDATRLYEELFFAGPTLININILTDINAKLTNDFALLFKPGFVLHKHTLFYGLIGPRWGNFETTASTTFRFQLNTTTPVESFDSETKSGYEMGFTAGVGIQQMLTDQLHLSLEYAYTTYGDIDSPATSGSYISGTPVPGSSIEDTTTFNVSTSTMMLALSYQW